ncbi:hypothetical protein OIU77_017262, partial [Salix suchowensis]
MSNLLSPALTMVVSVGSSRLCSSLTSATHHQAGNDTWMMKPQFLVFHPPFEVDKFFQYFRVTYGARICLSTVFFSMSGSKGLVTQL